jgi:hypothetical protein
MKEHGSIPVVMLALAVTACNRLGSERPYTIVGNSAAGLRAAFNADAGKVRVLMVVSPTCGACLGGASEVSEQIARIDQGQTIPLYVLWVPRRGGREKDVPAARHSARGGQSRRRQRRSRSSRSLPGTATGALLMTDRVRGLISSACPAIEGPID